MGRNLIRKGLSLKKMWRKSSCEGSFPVFSFSSAGYEHIVALSLTGALHQNAPLSGPIIMDSPFGRLDPDHKKKIASALPTMSNEVILLAYTSEIDEQDARERLGSFLNHEYRLTRYSAFNIQIERQN